MDPNQQQNNPTAPSAPNPMVSVNPVPPPAGQAPLANGAQMNPPKNGNKIILLAALAFVMLLIVIGLYYFASQYNAPSKNPQPTPVPTVSTPTLTPTPVLSENDIDAVDIVNPETELKPIDEDVKQL